MIDIPKLANHNNENEGFDTYKRYANEHNRDDRESNVMAPEHGTIKVRSKHGNQYMR